MTSSMSCHYIPWTRHTVGRSSVCHAIIALRIHSQRDDVRNGMSSWYLTTHSWTMSGVAYNPCLWRVDKIGRCRAWNALIALDFTHDQTTSVVACHHSPLIAHTIGRLQSWHAYVALAQHSNSNDIGRRTPSLPFYHTHKQTKFGMACHYRLRQHKGRMKLGIACPRSPWIVVSRMIAGVTCHQSPW